MRALGLGTFALLCLVACGGDGGGSYCARGESKLRSCGLLTEGVLAGCEEPTTALNGCRENCAIAASCDELRAGLCGGATSQSIRDCRQSCLERHGFRCTDGMFIRREWQCDGDADCSDGSDEIGCPNPTFTCANGSLIQARRTCDGFNDCSDGSDEAQCQTFQCRDGARVPLTFHCDGSVDCLDASDEIDGCPTFRCNDGALLPPSFECDGEVDCPDGSDELGCPARATLICI